MTGPTRTTSLQHNALFYSDDQTLAALAVPFVREGLDRGEVVFLNVSGHPVFPLMAALFADEAGVRFMEHGKRARPVSVIDQYKRAMDAGLRTGIPGYRAMGLIDLDRSEVGWLEWLRYEAAVNTIFERYPFRTMCTWDLRTIAPERAAAFRAAHPSFVSRDGPVRNEEYVEPEELVNRPEHLPKPDPVQSGPPSFEADVGPDLRHLRVEIYPVTLGSELSRLKIDDFVKAVGGVVLNAWAHGRGPVRLRLWVQPHKIVGTVTDRGPGIEDPFLGYAQPPRQLPGEPGTVGGLGLWAARQLCDTLDYARTTDGFTVRLVSHD